MPFSYANTNLRHRRLTVYQLRATVNASGDLDNALHAVADLVQNNLCWFYDVAMIEENGRLLFGHTCPNKLLKG